jgi:hypothetical protein
MECLFAINLLVQFRDYFFDKRLVCHGEDRCAIAHVITIEDNGDGDNSLNTILAPADADTTESAYMAMAQPAALVYPDPGLASRGWRLVPSANRPSLEPRTFGRGNLPFFHCEIEGTFLDDWTTALLAYLWVLFGLAAAALALAAASLALGPIGWVIWIAIALFILLAILFGASSLDEDEAGSARGGPIGDALPSPTGPVITDSGGNAVSVGDFVAMFGRHVCDTGHNPDCWNELHPLKAITKILQSEYESVPEGGGDILDKYCVALRDFLDETGALKQSLTCLEHPRVG